MRPSRVRWAMPAFLCLLLSMTSLFAVEKAPYLLTFPTISADSSAVYFQGKTWTAVWKREAKHPVCVPSSIVRIPPPANRQTISFEGDYFRASGDTLWWGKGIVARNAYVLPDPTEAAIQELRALGNIKPKLVMALGERIGPITATAGRLWFGLTLFDELSKSAIGGFGWFDIETEKFVRLYSADIGANRPQWITALHDSILILYASELEGTEDSRLYLYQIKSADFFEIGPETIGIAGEQILGAIRLGDSLLFSTDYGISLKQPNRPARNFATATVASHTPVNLSLLIFDETPGKELSEIPFDTLPRGVSTRIWWREGDWYEVAVPHPVEAFVTKDAWEEFGKVWQSRFWDCTKENCFARVQIPMRGEIQPADFIHTPLTYLGTTDQGIKIGVDAAWVRVEKVIPILVETQLQP